MILIVSDNEPLTNRFKSILEEEGYKIYVDTTGDRARSIGPVIVFLSFEMDGMDSIELFDAIRDTYHQPDIIMIGENISNGMIVKSILRGATDVIDVSFSSDKILAITRRLMKRECWSKYWIGSIGINPKPKSFQKVIGEAYE